MPGVMEEPPELIRDSSPSSVPQRTSSAESNFRELDDAFLQTQARIWLGEVLKIRFDEQTNISELLADGELLFELSEVLSRMLPTLSVDETQLKVYEWKSLASNKSTRRYMPYYNVDSFLRMCKNLGMDGIDLFTPSDVVERRNTRKVCMCLRSLSKKARLRDLIVPDFDSVTCTVAMPTDMVEGLRKSLEMSQSSSSLSVEQEAEKVARVRYWRRMSNSVSADSNGNLDNCDEAESSFVVADTYGSPAYAYDAESPNILGSQVVGEDDDQCEYLSPSIAESVGSPCSQYYSDEELRMPSSDCLGSRISGKFPEMNSETQHGCRAADVSHVPIDWGNSHVDVGNYKDGNAEDKIDSVSPGKENVNITCSHDSYLTGNITYDEHLETLYKPSKVDSKKSSELGEPPECAITDYCHAGKARRLSHEDSQSDNNAGKHEPFVCEVGCNNGKSYSHGETNDNDLSSELLIQKSGVSKPLNDPEVSYNCENHVSKAYAEIIHAVGKSCWDTSNNGNATSEDVEGQLRFREEQFPCSIDQNVHSCDCSSLLAAKSNSNNDHRIPARFVSQSGESKPLLHDVDTIISADDHYSQIRHVREAVGDNMIMPFHTEQQFDNGYMDGNASNSLDTPRVDMNSSPFMVVAKNSTKCSKHYHISEGSEGRDALVASVNCNPINIDDGSPKNVEDTGHVNHQCVKEVEKGESWVVKQEGTDEEMPSHKPPRKLLKSVVKGTALLGFAVFLLHLRKNRWENHSEAKQQSTHAVKQGLPKPPQKGQKGSSLSSVYPAEKLRFGI